jgi:hypothetical protein
MRIGSNPAKFDNTIQSIAYHRVIIPVYIPNHDGYFAQQFEIFKLCLESLLATIHPKTRITIYINGCIADVSQYIMQKYDANLAIDQVFTSDVNMGKINAILASSKGNVEPLITITDADVLFKHGWQQETELLMNAFPEAGMVAPVPSSKGLRYHTANNWLYSLIRGKATLEKVADPLALKRFDDSLGTEVSFYNELQLNHYVTISNPEGIKGAFGCGHFVVTMRREVFDKGSNNPAFVKIQGGVEAKFIDIPNEKLGFMRLSTLKNYAYHMGNTLENWIEEEFKQICSIQASSNTPFNFNEGKPFRFNGIHLLQRIINSKKILNLLLKLTGLNLPKGYV